MRLIHKSPQLTEIKSTEKGTAETPPLRGDQPGRNKGERTSSVGFRKKEFLTGETPRAETDPEFDDPEFDALPPRVSCVSRLSGGKPLKSVLKAVCPTDRSLTKAFRKFSVPLAPLSPCISLGVGTQSTEREGQTVKVVINTVAYLVPK
jgi:hypothetical protein